tara:strand:+ start:60 stop:2072 length:2013 start_codon:yes stop_codon:yes gene_type:complete
MEMEVAYTHKGNIFTLKKEEGESNIRHSIRVKFIQSKLNDFDYNLLEKYSSVYADSVLHGIEFPERVQKQLQILLGIEPNQDIEDSAEDEKLIDARINIEETYVTDASVTSIETDNDIKISVLGKESFLKTDGTIDIEDEPLIANFNHDVFSIKEGDESKGVSITVEHASGEDVTIEACGNVECSVGADVLISSLDKNGDGLTGIIRKKSVEDLTKEFSSSFDNENVKDDENSEEKEEVKTGQKFENNQDDNLGSLSNDIPLEPSEESEEISIPEKNTENNEPITGSESFSTPVSKETEEKTTDEIAKEQKKLANPKTIIIEESDESSLEDEHENVQESTSTLNNDKNSVKSESDFSSPEIKIVSEPNLKVQDEVVLENEILKVEEKIEDVKQEDKTEKAEEIKIDSVKITENEAKSIYEENLEKLKNRCNYFIEEDRDIYQLKANVRISILNRLKSIIDETFTDDSLKFIIQEYDNIFFENILNKVAKYQVKWNQSLDSAGNLDISGIDSNGQSSSENDDLVRSFFTLELSKPIFSSLKGNQNVFGIIANSQIESLILFIENFIGTMIHEICKPNINFDDMIKKIFGHMTDSVSFSNIDLNEKDDRTLRDKILDMIKENQPVIVKLNNRIGEFKVLGARNLKHVTLDGLEGDDAKQLYENISHINNTPI